MCSFIYIYKCFFMHMYIKIPSKSTGWPVPGRENVAHIFTAHSRMREDPVYMWGCIYVYQDNLKSSRVY
jgi:hypothetical protein